MSEPPQQRLFWNFNPPPVPQAGGGGACPDLASLKTESDIKKTVCQKVLLMVDVIKHANFQFYRAHPVGVLEKQAITTNICINTSLILNI